MFVPEGIDEEGFNEAATKRSRKLLAAALD